MRSVWGSRLATPLIALVAACGSGGSEPGVPDGAPGPGADAAPGTFIVPEAADWVDQGPIISEGTDGDWDRFLWGGFAGSAVRLGDSILLYYQGADGYDDAEGTVTYRAIGVARSTDGLGFVKHAGNPVVAWFPNNGIEEGAASGGATVSGGEVALFYGANTEFTQGQVNADGRVATSSDGLVFADQGVVLDHTDGQVWGSGDELFPVASVEHDGTWYAFYIPNGAPERGFLGVASGTSMTDLGDTAGVVDGDGNPVAAWGMSSVAKLGDGSLAVFVSDNQVPHITAWRMDPSNPAVFEGPIAVYDFANMTHGTVLLDPDTGTWFLYYRNENSSAYGVRTAPANTAD